MSEASRGRRLHVENRLEELATTCGPLAAESLDEGDLDSSWGPPGSLAARLLETASYTQLLEEHRAMLALDRQRSARSGEPTASRGEGFEATPITLA
jgi:hypothetical protein